MNRTFWAIKHLPSGGFLPQMQRGATHSEPTQAVPPRLFLSAKGAKLSLMHWLQGKLTVTHHRDSYRGDYYETWDLQPVEGRNPEDMRVVRLDFQEVPYDL